MKVFLDRPIEGDGSSPRIDATHVRVHQAGHIVSVAVVVAVNADGRREVLGMHVDPPRPRLAGPLLRKLARRGLRGVRLAVSDAHEGIKATVGKIFIATWQRCGVHFMRNALAHAGRSDRRVVSAACPERSRKVIGRHLPQRGRHHPPRRRHPARAER